MQIEMSARSAADVAIRALDEKLSEAFGQKFLVENRPGARPA